MTTQPPQQPGYAQQAPQQPGFPQQPGYAHQPGYPQPPAPPKKRSKVKLGCLGFLAVIVIGGIASVAGSGSDDSTAGAASTAASTGSSKGGHPSKTTGSPKTTGSSKGTGSSNGTGSAKTATPQQSTADAFKAYVKKHESAKTREAAAHVTKVQGADKNNDVLDTAEIYTDYTGDLVSADAGNAKLLASAFADFQAGRGKASKNGLVTVYNVDGDVLSNGNY
ncbi:hypothetical protein RKE30_38330 [Streptomyces sp. Li-HN-5-11]|uniref:hypothetical protein n=1 Tax=Streptomyces sp. Li-HN-5-11 TaxID=3075432 RepID=UPI0028AE7120|nr:hypothetical protein [Streptomyces sp. Li-HN-5-11]WNM35800.1 hypothetical protein RKE30_38330 [Streptomyces sp. Li-HN-5-11]